MYETINEPINVIASFANGKTTPLLFKWRSKNYQLKKLNFTHTSKDGNAKLMHFAAANETENYKLTYNTRDLIWTLDEIYRELIPVGKDSSSKHA